MDEGTVSYVNGWRYCSIFQDQNTVSYVWPWKLGVYPLNHSPLSHRPYMVGTSNESIPETAIDPWSTCRNHEKQRSKIQRKVVIMVMPATMIDVHQNFLLIDPIVSDFNHSKSLFRWISFPILIQQTFLLASLKFTNQWTTDFESHETSWDPYIFWLVVWNIFYFPIYWE